MERLESPSSGFGCGPSIWGCQRWLPTHQQKKPSPHVYSSEPEASKQRQCGYTQRPYIQSPHQPLREKRAGGPIRVPRVPPPPMQARPCIIAFLIDELLILVAL